MQQQEIAETTELRAARLAREAQALRQSAPPPPPPLPALRDPLPLCIYATVALLAWIFSPPLAVAWFAALGLRAYWRAWRAGLRRSNCLLRDPRLVMLYLGLLLVAGAATFLWNVIQLLS